MKSILALLRLSRESLIGNMMNEEWEYGCCRSKIEMIADGDFYRHPLYRELTGKINELENLWRLWSCM